HKGIERPAERGLSRVRGRETFVLRRRKIVGRSGPSRYVDRPRRIHGDGIARVLAGAAEIRGMKEIQEPRSDALRWGEFELGDKRVVRTVDAQLVRMVCDREIDRIRIA